MKYPFLSLKFFNDLEEDNSLNFSTSSDLDKFSGFINNKPKLLIILWTPWCNCTPAKLNFKLLNIIQIINKININI